MLVVFSVYFSTLISKNCSLISTSQLFPPESSSQFSTQTAYWDQKTTFYTEPLTYKRPHAIVCMELHDDFTIFFEKGKKLTCWAQATENQAGLA